MQTTRLPVANGANGVEREDLTVHLCRSVAQGIAASLPTRSRVCVATDAGAGRKVVKEGVVSSLLSAGVNVTDLGTLPGPAVARLTREMAFDTGIMITATHGAPEHPGVKLFNRSGMPYSRYQEVELEQTVRQRTLKVSYPGDLTQGQHTRDTYFRSMRDTFAAAHLDRYTKVVVDAGNGVAAGFAGDLFAAMGLTTLPMNDRPGTLFSRTNAGLTEHTLHGTVDFLRGKKADLAVCFDGDAGRVAFCNAEGFPGFGRMAGYLSRIAVKETGKKRVATTVETGRAVDLAVAGLGVEMVRSMAGDSDVAYLARDIDAAIGVDATGVYVIPEAGYCPDGMAAALKLLSRVGRVHEIGSLFTAIPQLYLEKSEIRCPEQLKEDVMAEIRKKVSVFGASDINIADGLRLEYDDAWMLLRPSDANAGITVMAESPSRSRTMRLLARGAGAVHSALARLEL